MNWGENKLQAQKTPVVEESFHSLSLSIIIPAYNEEKRIGSTLRQIIDCLRVRNSSAEIIVVNDGSTDRTASLARTILTDWPWSKIISFEKNRGKGAAVKEGVLQANGELILVTDADLSTPIEELEKFWPLAAEHYDLIIGSRALPASDIKKRQSWLRETMGKFFNLLVRWLVLPDFKDTQCGFKLFRKEASREIFARIKTTGFAFDVEVLLLARQLGYKIAEVPVVWINSPDSRVRLLGSSVKMLFELLRIRFRRNRIENKLTG
ncbi:MAG TPA: glycosyltransferase family 2 protein [Candidatus Saccharicenans sp.]|jgi:dolichyl-phosphate beta-glucosyltransferase|nr:glycosyltransferase family 2 protein [Candidatus Saccharicenans sp.]HRD01561.1 glycosyltransferase family 2 protein [Candidatus Saccharicenans sp.]